MGRAGRAFNQALKFGVEIAIPLKVTRLDCGEQEQKAGEPMRLELTNSGTVLARTVVVATGARYRRPAIPNLSTFEGRGISYWASPVEAKALRRRGGGARRRGQFCGTGRGVSRTEGKTLAYCGARAEFRSVDVALSHRTDRRAAQY